MGATEAAEAWAEADPVVVAGSGREGLEHENWLPDAPSTMALAKMTRLLKRAHDKHRTERRRAAR